MVVKWQYFCDQSPHTSPVEQLIHPQLFSSSSSLKSSNPPSAPGREGNKSPSPRCRQHLLPLVDHLPAFLRLGIWKNHQWHMETSKIDWMTRKRSLWRAMCGLGSRSGQARWLGHKSTRNGPLWICICRLRLGIWKNHQWYMDTSKMIGSWITWNGPLWLKGHVWICRLRFSEWS